ncbi:coiled-coil domain-containing protein mad1 [Mycoemilia scoparia]|uniref:Spindle assembly checkpoint component MAD1 n=1 Tax=Mycoemilia scoparia TaxID=417184 RepID=A0A9W8DQM2_9FUNG|nr:coiled-coil domain-containing protein mad1 [Mycoemilia scoparia]
MIMRSYITSTSSAAAPSSLRTTTAGTMVGGGLMAEATPIRTGNQNTHSTMMLPSLSTLSSVSRHQKSERGGHDNNNGTAAVAGSDSGLTQTPMLPLTNIKATNSTNGSKEEEEDDDDDGGVLSSVLRPNRLFTTPNSGGNSEFSGVVRRSSPSMPTITPRSRGKTLSVLGSSSPARSILESMRREDQRGHELEQAKQRMLKAESQAQSLNQRLEREKLETEKTHQMYKSEIRKLAGRIEKLEKDRKWLFEQEEAAQARIKELESSSSNGSRQQDETEKYWALEQQFHDLTAEHEDLQIEYCKSTRLMEQQKIEFEHTTESLKRKCSKYVEQIQQQSEKLKDMATQIADCHHQEMAMKSQRGESSKDNENSMPSSSSAITQKEVSELLSHIRNLETQNKKLAEKNTMLSKTSSRVGLISEENMALKSKVERLEKEMEQSSNMHSELEVWKQERDQWDQIFNEHNHQTGDGSRDDMLPKSAFAAVRLIKNLYAEADGLRNQIDEYKHLLSTKNQDVGQAHQSLEQVRQKCRELEIQASKERASRRSVEKIKQMAQREVAFLRDQLRLYDTEETANITMAISTAIVDQASAAARTSGMVDYDDVQKKLERINKLETLVEQQREWLKELENEILNTNNNGDGSGNSKGSQDQIPNRMGEETDQQKQQRSISRSAEAESLATQYQVQLKYDELQDKYNQLETKYKELEDETKRVSRKYAEVEQEAAKLEWLVGEGHHDPTKERILELRDNPTSIEWNKRKRAIETLEAENQAMAERIKELLQAANDNSGNSSENQPLSLSSSSASSIQQSPMGTPLTLLNNTRSSSNNNNNNNNAAAGLLDTVVNNLKEENKELVEQNGMLEKRIERLKSEWLLKAQEMRQAVYSLLGYRLDFLPNGKFRLTSMYSEHRDQCFNFTSSSTSAVATTKPGGSGSNGADANNNSGDGGEGTMVLTGGGSKEYLNNHVGDINYWIRERGSVPIFLATIIIKEFENWEKRQQETAST